MKDTGECAICLDELLQGDTIARLPCLCIYHKGYQICWISLGELMLESLRGLGSGVAELLTRCVFVQLHRQVV